MSALSNPGAEIPINTSAPLITSERLPDSLSGFVISAIFFLIELRFSRPLTIAPLLSVITIFLNPAERRSLTMAIPAAPDPEVTILTFLSFPTTFKAFVKPANVIMAVPC